MKVSSLGYNPKNQTVQNYKKNQHNPAFSGSIKLTSDGLEKINLVLETANDLLLFIRAKVKGTVEFTIKAIADKVVSVVKYDSKINPDFDGEAEKLVSKLNIGSTEQKLGILFEFNDGKQLN